MNRLLIVLFICSNLVCSKNHTNTSSNPVNANSISKKDSTNLKDINVIPSELLAFINEKLSNYRIPRIDEYNSDWVKFLSKDKIPFYCTSDFTGNGKKDHALLLMSDNQQFSLFVFNTEGTDYKYYLLDNYKLLNNKICVLLSVQEKGIWEGIDISVNVKNDGIKAEKFCDSKAKAYYWDIDKYVEFIAD